MSTFKCPLVKFTLEKHTNSDTLSIAHIEGKDWTCVVKTEDFLKETIGTDLAIYVPIDAIADKEHPLLNFLEGKKVKTCRLRGVLSQGVLLPYGRVMVYLSKRGHTNYTHSIGTDFSEVLDIKKYEPPVNYSLGYCDSLSPPDGLSVYTDIENWKNYPDVIKDGENVFVTEKIHGANCRFALIGGIFYIGSHRRVLRLENYVNASGQTIEIKPTVWHKVAELIQIKPILEKISQNNTANVIIYGELFGKGVQDLSYGQTGYNFVVFDININGEYLSPKARLNLINSFGLTSVPVLYDGEFNKDVLNLRLGKDVISNSHVREGIIIEPCVPRFDQALGRVKLKFLSEEYLSRKNATDYEG